MADVFTIDELSKRWRMSRDSIVAHIKSGRLAAFNAGQGRKRKHWRVSFLAVQAFEQTLQPPDNERSQKTVRAKRRERGYVEYF